MNSQNLKASVSFVGDGSTNKFYFGFDYINKQFVKVQVGAGSSPLTYLTDYTVDDRSVVLKDTPAVGVAIRVYRETPSDRIVEWADGAFIKASQMTLENLQQLHLIEEAQDYPILSSLSRYPDGVNFNALDSRITGVKDPIDPQDVVTKHYMENVQSGFVAANTNILNETKDTLNATKQTQSKAQANENLSKAWAVSTESPDGAEDTQSDTGKTQSSRTWALRTIQAEQNAKTSETNAKASETKAKTSETNAKTSETNAKASETNANTSETNAKNSETKAKTSENNAKASENNAKTSETNAGTYASNAKASEINAKASETNAKASETNSELSHQKAKKWAEATESPDGEADMDSTTGKTQSSKAWALYSKTKAQESATSATNAKSSETNAKTSEINAKTSETNAKASETKAKTSETNAKTAETNASASASASATSASASATSATNAHNSEIAAANSAKQAAESAGVFQDFKGATASTDGNGGKVPKPLAGQQNKVLKADGTWGDGVTPKTLSDGLYYYPFNYVPPDTANSGWSKLGLCSIFYGGRDIINNQPTMYGQLINLPIKGFDEIAQLWITQPTGRIMSRSGNLNTSIDNKPFDVYATTDEVKKSIEDAVSFNMSSIINTLLPVGIIIEFTNNTDPNELYPGTTWVKMDAGRVLISAGTYTENGNTYTYSLGNAGGEAKHQSTIDETPSHSHNTTSAGNHTHFIANDNVDNGGGLTNGNHLIKKCTWNSYENFELIGSGKAPNIGLTSSSGDHTHSISETGGNQPHENRMPYQVINRWKRTA